MKKIPLILLWLSCTAITVAQQKKITIWYTPVQKPTTAWNEYYSYFAPVDIAQDLAGLLRASAGLSCTVMPYDGKSQTGIFLLLDSTKKSLANEAAIVNSDGKTFLKIEARYATGISYAAYTYLEKAGFKFYLPGSKWTVVPQMSTAFMGKITNEQWKPYFKVRTFFLSGAMKQVKDLDPAGNNFKEWNTWYRRNRMGSEYIVMGGHIGEIFNLEHQKEIEKDSMILAPVNGRRSYNTEGKLDPTYEKGVNLFLNWIVQQYKNDNRVVPSYIPVKKYQSVDPGDALNYCHSPECIKKFGSVSNQVFSVANRAAVKFKTIYPGAGVNLYAYTERADTPSIKIEDNVHVCIVAGAFQNVSTPAGLINKWAKKTKHTSIYDYLNICVWNKDHPFFNLGKYFDYLNFVKKSQVEGFTYESGGSTLSAALIQYFVLKYLCDPYADVKKEFDSFCKDIFGNAAEPVKKILQEWYFSEEKTGHTYDHTTFNETEIGRYVQLVQQASNTSGLLDIQKERIFELKAYIVYLAKYYELRGDIEGLYLGGNSAAFIKSKTDEILTYTWMLYPTLLFHNTQLTDLLKGNFAGDAALINKWDYAYSDNFKNITAGAERKVAAEFAKVFEKYNAKAAPYFADAQALLAKAYPYRADTVKLKLIDAVSYGNYRNSMNVYCGAPTKLTIRYTAKMERIPENKTSSIGFIALIKDDYSVITEVPLYASKTSAVISFVLPSKGDYKLYLGQNNATSFDYTILPGNSLIYTNKFVIPMNGILLMDDSDHKYNTNEKMAFYTGNADSIAFSMIYPEKSNWVSIYNSKGVNKVLTVNKPPYHMAAKLDAAEKNSFMYFTNGLFRWPPAFKTIPNYFFYLKFPLVPKK